MSIMDIDEKHSGSGRNSLDVRDEEIQIVADEIECPPHTTERRLMAKIDMRVVPFLCIMYLLAFLGELIAQIAFISFLILAA
jgi:hypothetical protein